MNGLSVYMIYKYFNLLAVVVMGFQRNFYVVYEGLDIEICVAVLDRELSNDEDREFTVATSQLTSEHAATGENKLASFLSFSLHACEQRRLQVNKSILYR